MTIEYFDGFDWVGDNTAGSIADDLKGRGWTLSDGINVTAAAPPDAMYEDWTFTPAGKTLRLAGTGTKYISHAVKPWIDAAVGLNFYFNSLPVGAGPHKLIELCEWSAGSMNPLYTLAIKDGQFALYAYGEIGAGAVFEGYPWFLGALQTETLYSVHYYARRSQRILYVNGRAELLRGGYGGLSNTHAVRVYDAGDLYIDDFYNTWTQPAFWPFAYDVLFPYAYYNEITGAWAPHRVLSPKPEAELDMTGAWQVQEGGSLVTALNGSDAVYTWKNAQEYGNFQVKLEDVDFPTTLEGFQYQGLVRCNRQGSLTSQGFFFEGRYPGIQLIYENPFLDPSSAVAKFWHEDTIAIGNGDIRPSPRDFRTEVNHARMFIRNGQVSSIATDINKINWSLIELFLPNIYALGV